MGFDHKEITRIFEESDRKYNDFFEYINSLPLSIQIIPLQIGSHIFRGRHSDIETNFYKFDDFKYPPSSSNFSRVGVPGDIWFYASETYETCLVEMMRELMVKYSPGSKIKITFGRWQVRENVNLLVLPDFSLKCKISKHLRLDSYYSKNEREIWENLNRYFYSSTSTNTNIHELTSAVVSSLLLRLERDQTSVDGLLFPSVEHRTNANLGFRKEIIDQEKVILHDAMEMIFIKHNELNSKGLPSYTGPFNEKKGTFDPLKREINWWE